MSDRPRGRWVPWYGRGVDRRAFACVLCSGSVAASVAASVGPSLELAGGDDDLAGWLCACTESEPFELMIEQGGQRWRATVTSVQVRSDAW